MISTRTASTNVGSTSIQCWLPTRVVLNKQPSTRSKCLSDHLTSQHLTSQLSREQRRRTVHTQVGNQFLKSQVISTACFISVKNCRIFYIFSNNIVNLQGQHVKGKKKPMTKRQVRTTPSFTGAPFPFHPPNSPPHSFHPTNFLSHPL